MTERVPGERVLIVARIEPGATGDVAALFARSDETELPRVLGVRRRELFHYHDLYFHHVEFAGRAAESLATARDRADFRELSAELDPFISPFDPATWRGPVDALATRFYQWSDEDGAR